MARTADTIHQGRLALRDGDPIRAEEIFASAVAGEATPEALEGLAEALWWQNKLDSAMLHHEKAYAEYRRSGDVANASRLALFISGEYATNYGNTAAAQGWFARADRLLAGHESGAAVARLALVRAERAASVDEALRLAGQARQIARACGDADNEFHAMAILGRIEVSRGNVDVGMAYLDESMAAAMGGEVKSRLVVGPIYCCMIIACERIGDCKRAAEWCAVVDEYTRRYHYTPLFAFCRIVYGSVLTAMGRWTDAEKALQTALQTYEGGHRAMAPFARAALSELRIRQGRLEEAEALLDSCREHPAACSPIVRLCLSRGDLVSAQTTLTRRLGESSPSLANFALFDLRVDLMIALGDLDAALQAVDVLAALAQRVTCLHVSIAAELAAARVAAARDDGTALAHLEKALDLLSGDDFPFERARVKAMIAVLLATREPARVVTEARSALGIFQALGAARDATSMLELLRRVDVEARSEQANVPQLSKRENEVLPLVAAGLSNPEIAARLRISPKTVEHHVSNILSKLGLRNRAAAAAWATRQQAK